jgi:hypothetical protein
MSARWGVVDQQMGVDLLGDAVGGLGAQHRSLRASSECTMVIPLSPACARPGASQVDIGVEQLAQAQPDREGGRQQPSVGHESLVVKGHSEFVGL